MARKPVSRTREVPEADEHLTIEEIARQYKLNQQTVRNFIDRRELPAVRIGRRIRVRRKDLEEFVRPAWPDVSLGAAADDDRDGRAASGGFPDALAKSAPGELIEALRGFARAADRLADALEHSREVSGQPPSAGAAQS